MSYKDDILKKISSKKVVVGILGLGYVGLPLAVAFAKNKVKVIGFDKSENKVKSVNISQNYIQDVDSAVFNEVVKNGLLTATTDFTRIKDCDAVIICVPTPLDKFQEPDMSYIESACLDIAKYMKAGTFISLESTTYPTTTEVFMKPIIEKNSGLKENIDFWLCFSPERVDPGNKQYKTENTPKVIGGLGQDAQKIALELYQIAIKQLYPVSSPRAAEMVKILENTYRLINISLINELALLSGKMDINIWEVIEAAKTKPYGFQAFYPGPGIGGHCIPLDPFYLEYVAKGFNFDLTMIHTAGQINNLMPYRMMNKISYALNRQKKPLNGSTILFLGVAYKPDIDDSRESPALLVMEQVAKKGAKVIYHDPYIPDVVDDNGHHYKGVELTDELISSVDCVVFTTNHSCFDIDNIVSKAKLVVDLRNAVKQVHIENDKVFKL
ncbi:MAG: nucleotide sugar dehydrogenase [Spirochaetes bacterium]|nr:nucleotide sugar dehydrogenase [Spirochaetota bacterium]MBP8991577.1 nucleotide sugar dehydrogenase [Spirochaetota bacterium]HOV46991.1 nucleotide sugar dehydrogenase [Exilispira sp.]HQM89007.1 nucleotide sugar dehydrogenase [Exilispira sp.]HQQ19507.1 nucleotide sugar dehydrogenase [Exilispira sp.]